MRPTDAAFAVPFIITSMELLCCRYLNDDLARGERSFRGFFLRRNFRPINNEGERVSTLIRDAGSAPARLLHVKSGKRQTLVRRWQTSSTWHYAHRSIWAARPSNLPGHRGRLPRPRKRAVKICIGFRKRKRLFTHNSRHLFARRGGGGRGGGRGLGRQGEKWDMEI